MSCSRFGLLALAVVISQVVAVAASANNLPTGFNPHLSTGVQSVHTDGKTQTITTHAQRSLGSFHDFNIGHGYKVDVHQPGHNAAFMAKVRNVGAPSKIYGQLNSNGAVGIINPAGVFVGKSGVVNTQGGFLATTQKLNEHQYLNGEGIHFTANSHPNNHAKIQNDGTIHVGNNKFVALVGPEVINNGTISVADGNVALASAQRFSLQTKDGILLGLNAHSLSHKLGGASVQNNGHVVVNTIATNASGDIVLKAVDGHVVNRGDLQNDTAHGGIRLEGQRVRSEGKNTIASKNYVALTAPDGVHVNGTDISGENVYLTATHGHGGIGISRYKGDRAVIQAHDGVYLHTDQGAHVSLGTLEGGKTVSIAATGGDVKLYPESKIQSGQDVSVYAKKRLLLEGNGHEGAQVSAHGGHISLVGEEGVSLGRRSLVANTANGAVGIFTNGNLHSNGKIVTENGDIHLGAGTHVLGGEIFVDHGSEILATAHGNVSLGSANDVHILNGTVGSNGGAVSLGAGDDVSVEGHSLVYAIDKPLSIGAGDKVDISGVVANTSGPIHIGAGNLVQVSGEVKAEPGTVGNQSGPIAIGSGKDIVVDGVIGSESGDISLGSGSGIHVTHDGNIGSQSGDISLGTGGSMQVRGKVASHSGTISLGAGHDVLVNDAHIATQTGGVHVGAGETIHIQSDALLASNSGPVTLGAGHDIKLHGKVTTHSGPISLHAGRNIDMKSNKAEIASYEGPINMNAYHGKINVRGRVESVKNDVSIKAAKTVHKDPHAHVNAGGHLTIKEHVKF